MLRSIFTGKDNCSIDIGRVIWAIMSIFMCAMTAFSVIIRGQPFDAVSFSGAAAAIMTSGGASLAFKRSTEPGG